MMRIPSASVVFAFLSLLAPPGAAQEVIFGTAIPTCKVTFGSREQHFAHCAGAERNYLTAVVALHGWNGSCGDTFGKLELSMFSVMEDEQFYDWDCFDYASHSLDIEQNVEAFEKQINHLSDLGYENILLLTHSTGGIIALEFLLRRVFDENGDVRADALNRVSGPVVHEAAIWAIPINGLQFNTSLAAGALSFFQNFSGATEQTLPDLQPGSAYLQKLYSRLLNYRSWFEGLSPDDQMTARVEVTFLHGQGSDWVVRPIAAAPLPDWLGPQPTIELILTDMPHLASVNEAGHAIEAGAPVLHQMPAVVMSLVTRTSAPYEPRYRDVFFHEHNPSLTAERRQNAVLDQLNFYASVNLQASAAPAMRLFALMLDSAFPHYARVDERLVDELIAILRRGVKTTPQFAAAAVSAMNLIAGNPFSEQTTTMPGQGQAAYVKKVLVLLEELRNAAKNSQGYYDDKPDDLIRMQTAVLGAQYQILASTPHDDVRDATLGYIVDEIAIADERVVIESGIIDRIASSYYLPRAGSLPASTQSLLADFFASAVERDDAVTAVGLEAMNLEIQSNGRAVPIWQSLESEKLVQSIQGLELNSRIDLDPAQLQTPWQINASDQLIQFHTNVVRGVGFDGSDIEGGNISLDILKQLAAGSPVQQNKVVVYSNESPLNIFVNSANQQRLESLTTNWGESAACC